MVSGESEQIVVEAERSVKVENGGIVVITDIYTLSASEGSEATLSDFWVGFSDSITRERTSFEVLESGSWKQVDSTIQSVQGVSGSRIEFAVPVTLSDGNAISIKASYLTLDSVSGSGITYTALLPFYPVLEYPISQYQLDVDLPPGAIFEQAVSPINMTEVEVGDHWNVNYQGENIAPESRQDVRIVYTHSGDDELLLIMESTSRDITVKSSGLAIEDTYTLTNIGPIIYRFPLVLPSDAGKIKARDGVGSLETEVTESGSSKEVVVLSRSPVMPENRWVFSVSYTTASGDHISASGGASHISYPNIELPHFIREIEATIGRVEGDVVQLSYDSTLQSERSAIEADIPPGSIMPVLKPVAIVAGLGLIIIAIVFLRRREKPAKVEVTIEAEVPTLKEFTEKQRERLSILQALDSLEAELEEGKIEKEQYDRLAAEHNREVKTLVDSLKRLGKELSDEPELSEALKAIEQADAELARIALDLRNLDLRLRTRRVTRRDYDRRKGDRIRRRGIAISKIERAVESLGG